jgi:hypothetical protein
LRFLWFLLAPDRCWYNTSGHSDFQIHSSSFTTATIPLDQLMLFSLSIEKTSEERKVCSRGGNFFVLHHLLIGRSFWQIPLSLPDFSKFCSITPFYVYVFWVLSLEIIKPECCVVCIVSANNLPLIILDFPPSLLFHHSGPKLFHISGSVF